MIEDVAARISHMQTKKPWIFILVFLLITLALLPGIVLLLGNVEPSLEKVLPQSISEVKLLNDMRTEFGADMIYIIFYTDGDVRDPAVLRYIDAVDQKLILHSKIVRIQSLSELVKEQNGELPASLNQAKEILQSNEYASQFVDSSYSWTVLKIQADTGADAAIIGEVLDDVEFDIVSLDALNPSLTYQITGFPAIDRATFSVIMNDFASITFISFALVGLVVFFTFRSITRGVLPLIVVMMALLWTMGIVGYLGLTITVVSMVSAAMIMGLGIDFGIHYVYTYFEERKTHSAKKATQLTLSELMRAMLGASLTTSAGFLALLFGVLPAMKTLGIILAIGIIATLIGALLLLPPIVYLVDLQTARITK